MRVTQNQFSPRTFHVEGGWTIRGDEVWRTEQSQMNNGRKGSNLAPTGILHGVYKGKLENFPELQAAKRAFLFPGL